MCICTLVELNFQNQFFSPNTIKRIKREALYVFIWDKKTYTWIRNVWPRTHEEYIKNSYKWIFEEDKPRAKLAKDLKKHYKNYSSDWCRYEQVLNFISH